MDSTIPADLLKLKARLEAWRATRRYARQPIPEEFRQAAAEMTERHSPSLVRRVLKLDPWRVKKPATKKRERAQHKLQTDFFSLPPEAALLLPGPLATQNLTGYRLQIERPDGSRFTLMLPSLDLASIHHPETLLQDRPSALGESVRWHQRRCIPVSGGQRGSRLR